MSNELQFSEELRTALLTGAFDTLAPVIRIGNDRWVRYDEIKIMHHMLTFSFKGQEIARMVTKFDTTSDLTITGLEGRMQLGLR